MTKTEASAIRSFHVSFPEAELTDLRRRVNATRWHERETVTDATQGVQLATMQKLADYWGKDHDWGKCEAKLKALPHFITEIDGLDIHFIHVRSKHEHALPIIVTHGWPGSVIEQLKIIGPLTSNRAIIFALLDRPEGATLEECSAAIRNRSRTLVSLRTDLDDVARITQRPLVRIKDRCYLGDRP
jgi:hypothetical protein